METKILEDKQEPLLARRVLLVEVSFGGKTPSRLEMRKGLADGLKIDEQLTVIKSIDMQFGYKKANVTAHVYKSKKDLDAVEPKHIIKRHLPKGKKEAKPAEEKKQEAKPEEKKEEAPKAEEKKEEQPKEEQKSEEKKKEVKEEPKQEEAKAE